MSDCPTLPLTRLADGWRHRVDSAWLEGWQPRAFPLPGGGTEAVLLGSGPPLLLLPPLPGFKEAWIRVAGRLARRWRVVVFDLRAHPPGPGAWAAHLDDLERVADGLAPGAAAVVGHSLGGALAQQWALRRPGRVAALVLSSSFAHVAVEPRQWRTRVIEQIAVLASQRLLPEPLAARIARRLAARGAWVYDSRCDDEVLALVRFCIRTLPIGLARDRVRLALAHDTRASLSALACPTLMLVGEREAPWVHAAAEELRRLIPGAEPRVSPGAGHLHPLSAPEWFADTVSEWLAGRERVAR